MQRYAILLAMMKTRILRSICLAVASSMAFLSHAPAGEIGHQGGASFNPGDYFAPPKAFVFSLYGNSYSTRALRDGGGNEITGFEVFGRRIDLDIDVESFQVIPMIIWSPGVKFLGADVSSLFMPIYGQTSIAANVSAFGRRIQIDEDVWGFQDSYVQPAWLTWRTAHWDFSTSYGFWAPTGSYEPDALDNTGAGFWSHLFRASTAWSPDGKRGTLLTGSLAYEFNGEKKGVDLTPGSHLTLDVGVKHNFSQRFEAGVYGFAQWQVADDKGRDAVNAEVRDRLFGAGVYASYWFVPQKFGLLARYTCEFGARDRFEGNSTALGFNWVF
jgi:hypothetical protein